MAPTFSLLEHRLFKHVDSTLTIISKIYFFYFELCFEHRRHCGQLERVVIYNEDARVAFNGIALILFHSLPLREFARYF